MHRISAGRWGRWAVLGAVAAVLLAACSDDDDESAIETGPRTVNVLAGLNDQQDPNIVVNEYLPERVSITIGSTVEWRFAGLEPHSVTFFPPGQTPPPGGTDESLFRPGAPPTAPYDGKSVANSGLLPSGPAPASPFRLTFAVEGEYGYVCLIHPLMSGTVNVAGPSAAVDSQADVNERADSELNRWLEEGRAAKKKLTDAGPTQVKSEEGPTTWTYQMGATTEHTDVLAFAPDEGEVRPGDSVTFVNNSLTPHTATFASGGQVPQNPDDPVVARQTGPSPLPLLPAGGPYNSGILPPAAPPNAPPPEPARSFTFVVPEAGEYPYVCVLHIASDMVGTIKVA